MNYRKRTLLLAAICASGAIQAADAESIDTPQTLTSGKPWTLAYPDTWTSSMTNSGGTLNITNPTDSYTLGTGGTTGTFSQTAGSLVITNGSGLTLNSGGGSITGGNISLGDDNPSSGTLVINNGLSTNRASVTTNENSENNTLTLGSGTGFTMTGGTVNASTKVNVNAGGTLTVDGTGAVLNLDLNQTVTDIDGTLNLSSGTLNLSDALETSEKVGFVAGGTKHFNQTGGNLNLSGVEALDLSGDTASSRINISSGSDSFVSSSSTVKLNSNSAIGANARFEMTGGDLTLNGAELNLNSGDGWNSGTVTVDNGNLNWANMTKGDAAVLKQTGGTVNVTSGTLNMNISTDDISGGNLNLSSGATVDAAQGNIREGAVVNVASGSNLNVNGARVTLDRNSGTADTWNGNVSLSSGNLNLNGFTGTSAVTTNSAKTLNVTGGTLYLNDSNITFDTSASRATGGSIRVDDTSKLTFNNGVVNTPTSVVFSPDTDSSTASLVVTSKSDSDVTTLTSAVYADYGDVRVGDGSYNAVLNLTGGNIGAVSDDLEQSYADVPHDAVVNIAQKGTINVNGTNAVLRLDPDDTWNGNVKLTEGYVLLFGREDDTDANKTFVQTGGDLLLSDSALALDPGSSITGGEDTRVSIWDGAGLLVNNAASNSAAFSIEGGAGLVVSGGSSVTAAGASQLAGAVIVGTEEDTVSSSFVLADNSAMLDNSAIEVGNSGQLTFKDTAKLTSGTVDVSGKDATVTIQDATTFTGGNINVTGQNASVNATGDLTIDFDNLTYSYTNTPVFSGTNVTVSGTNSKFDADKVVLSGGSITAGNNGTVNFNGSVAKAGTLAGSGNGVINFNESLVAPEEGSSVYPVINLTDTSVMNANSGFIGASNVSIGSGATLNVKGADVWLDENTNWAGHVDISGGNLLALGIPAANKTGYLTQTVSDGTFTVGGDFYMNNAADNITAGDVEIGYIIPDSETGELVHVPGAIHVEKGNIGEGAVIYMDDSETPESSLILSSTEGATVTIADTSHITAGRIVNGTSASDNVAGVLTLKGAGANVSTNSNLVFVQNSGTLNIQDGASLTLNPDASNRSFVNGGTVNLNGAASSLTIANGISGNNSALNATSGNLTVGDGTNPTSYAVTSGELAAAVVTDIKNAAEIDFVGSDTTASFNSGDTVNGVIGMENATVNIDGITVNGGLKANSGNLNIGQSQSATVNTGNGGGINSAVNVALAKDSTINVSEGSTVVFDENDTWNGRVNNTFGGDFILTNSDSSTPLDIVTGPNSTGDANVIYQQTKGNLTLNGNVNLTLSDGDANSYIDTETDNANGNVTFYNGTLTLNENSKIGAGSTVTMNNGTLNVNGAKVTLNSGDTLNNGLVTNFKDPGSVNVTGSDTNLNVKYQQTAGTLSVTDGASLSLTDSDSYVRGGTVNIDGAASSLTLANGVENNSALNATSGHLTVGDGVNKTVYEVTSGNLNPNVVTNIRNASEIDFNNPATTASFNSGDTVDGYIGMNGATVNIDGITVNGGIKADAGNLNIGQNQSATVNTGSEGYINRDAVVALAKDSTINISANSQVELDNKDTWNGAIYNTNEGGRLTLTPDTGSSINIVTGPNSAGDANVVYVQTKGDLVLNGGVNMTLSDGDTNSYIDTETGNANGNVTVNSGTLTLNEASKIGADSKLTLDNATLNINGAKVALNSGDSLVNTNTITNNKDGGSLTITDVSGFDGIYQQTAGDLTLNNSTVNLASDLTFNNGIDTTNGANGNVTLQNNSKLTLNSKSNIAEGSVVSIDGTSELVLDKAAVVLNQNGVADDTWGGKVTNNNGTLTVKGMDVSTDGSVGYVQKAGTLTLDDASLALNDSGSVIGLDTEGYSGRVNINNGSSLVVANGVENQAEVVTDDSTGNVFTVTNGSTFVADGDTDIVNNTTVTLNGGGKLVLDGTSTDDANIALNSGDIWNNGTIDVVTGTLTVTGGGIKTWDSEGAVLTQNSANGKTVVLDNSDDWFQLNENDSVTAGKLVIGNGTPANAATVAVTGSGELPSDVSVDITDYSTLALSDDANVILTGGSGVTDDTWNGSINQNGGGNLTVKDMGDVVTDSSKTYIMGGLNTPKAGTLTLDNTRLTLNEGSYVRGSNSSSQTHLGDGAVHLKNEGALNLNNNTTNDFALYTDDETLNTFSVKGFGPDSSTGEDRITTVTLTGGEVNRAAHVALDKYSDVTLGKTVDGEPAYLTLNNVSRTDNDPTSDNDYWSEHAKITVNGGSLGIADSDFMTEGSPLTEAQFAMTDGTLTLNNTAFSIANGGMINGGSLLIDDGSTFDVRAGSFHLTGGLVTSGTINTMNGTNETHIIDGDLIINNSTVAPAGDGIASFAVDLGRAEGVGDSFQIGGKVTTTDPTLEGTISLDQWQISGDGELGEENIYPVFNPAGGTDENVKYVVADGAAEAVDEVTGMKYTLKSLGDGRYSIARTGGGGIDYNNLPPQYHAAQVSTIAAFANQNLIDNILFDHVDMINQGDLAHVSSGDANKYAATMPQFAPYQYTKETGGIWFKTYGNFETLYLKPSLDVKNNAYGALVGVDMPINELGHGWRLLPTLYTAYNGAHQTYRGTSLYQNGGQGGIMGTFMKGNFIGSLLGYGGGFANHAMINHNSADTGCWFAGTAAKTAYNFNLPHGIVIQPTAMAAYNIFGRQSFGPLRNDMIIDTGYFNGINLAPGVNVIWNKETFSLYGTAQVVFNINAKTPASVNGHHVKDVEMKTAYVEYGVGFKKTFTDRFSAYLQSTFRAGARLGAMFQGGLEFRL